MVMQIRARCRTKGLLFTVGSILRTRSISDLAAEVQHNSTISWLPEEQVDLPFRSLTDSEAALSIGPSRHRTFQPKLSCMPHSTSASSRRRPRSRDDSRTALNVTCARFTCNGDGEWSQYITRETEPSYRFGAQMINDVDAVSSIIESVQQKLCVCSGPVLGIELLDLMVHGNQLLFLTRHYLVINPISWRILLEDLEALLLTGSVPEDGLFIFSDVVSVSGRKYSTSQMAFSTRYFTIAC